MRKYRKPLPLLEHVTILDAGSEGKAVGRVGELVVFVPFAVPGDIVDIQVVKKKKSYLEGKVVHFHHYAERRVEAFCPHFGLCGGCRWQNLSYTDQLFYKQKQVQDAFDRIGKLTYPAIHPIKASALTTHYRNKLEYTFSNRRWLEEVDSTVQADPRALGFHIPQLFDRVLDIQRCYLQADPSDAIRQKAREVCLATGKPFYDARTNQGFFRNLWIRTSSQGDCLLILVVAEEDMATVQHVLDSLGEAFPEVNSLMYTVNKKLNDSMADQEVILYRGKGYLEEKMDELVFRVSPVSFFQVNLGQALDMYRLTRDSLALEGGEVVYDLYTGTGTIANFVAPAAGKVVGIEYVEEAVRDAAINSGINGIENVDFVAGDMVKVLNDALVAKHGKPDVIITDPPRAGMHEKVVEQILRLAPSRIVYISCNPATQARDLALLSESYDIKLVQPYDMFPHTHHVECLTLLKLRDSDTERVHEEPTTPGLL